MEEKTLTFELNLDESKEKVLDSINKIVEEQKKNLVTEGQIALNFLLKKKGEKPKTFVYNLTKDKVEGLEKDFVFPKVIEGVLKKEFTDKIAKNPGLMEHISKELRNDPYWSDRVVDLIKTLKEN